MAQGNVTIRVNWKDSGVSRGADLTRERIDRVADATERAAGKSDRMRDAYDRVDRSGARLTGTLGKLGPAIIGVFSVVALQRGAQLVLTMVRLSDQSELTFETFNRLATKAGTTGVAQLNKMRDAVGGTLSDLELMQRVGAAVDAGLTFDQAITALEFLRRYSAAFGKDFNQLVQTVFVGLARGSVLMLDDAGLVISATDEMFDGLDDVEKKSALVAEAIRLMIEKMETLPEIQENATTEAEKLGVAWEGISIRIGMLVDGPMKYLIEATAFWIDLLGNATLPEAPPRTTAPSTGDLIQKRYGRELSFEDSRYLLAQAQKDRQDAIDRIAAAEASLRTLGKSGVLGGEDVDDLKAKRQGAQDRVWLENRAIGLLERWIAEIRPPEQISEHAMRGYRSPVPRPAAPPIDYDFPEDVPEDVTITPTDLFGEEIERANNAKKIAQQLLEIEAKAGNDQVALRKLNLKKERDAVVSAFRIMGASFEEIQRVHEAYEILLAQTEQHKGHISDTTAAIRFLFNALAFLPDELQRGGVAAISFVQTGIEVIDTIDFLSGALTDLPSQIVDVGKKMADLFSKHGTLAVGLIALTAIVGIFMARSARAKQIEAENKRLREEQYRAQQKLNDAIRDAIDLQGDFVRSLSGLDSAQLLNQFNNRIHIIERTMGTTLGVIPSTIESQAPRIKKLIEDKYKGRDDFNFLFLALNEAITIIRQMEKLKADTEIEAREGEAKVIIAAIERQREEVLAAYTNAEEAQRAAALRAVGAQFDYLEAELRSKYSAQLQSVAGNDAATHIIRQQAFSDIETLRSQEAGAISNALDAVTEEFREARDNTNAFYDGLVESVELAIPDLSVPFSQAIAQQTQAFLERWNAGLVLKEGSAGFKLPESVIKKLSAGEALTTKDVTDLLLYQSGIQTRLDNALLLGLSENQIEKLTNANTVTGSTMKSIAGGSVSITITEEELEKIRKANEVPIGPLPEGLVVPIGPLPEGLVVPIGPLPGGSVVPAGVQPNGDALPQGDALTNIATKMDRWITIADTDVVGQALHNAHMRTKIDRWITIADTDVVGQALHNTTVKDSLTAISSTLSTIKDNTQKLPDLNVSVDVGGITIDTDVSPDLTPEDEDALAAIITQNIMDSLRENSELSRYFGG